RSSPPAAPRVAILVTTGLGLGLRLALDREGLPQALTCTREGRASGDMRDAQRLGQLEPGEVVELGEEQCRALALRDALERALEVARQAQVHRQVLGRWRRALVLAGEREEPDDPPAAQLVERDAVSDPVEPGPRVLGCFEGVVRAVRLDERVL